MPKMSDTAHSENSVVLWPFTGVAAELKGGEWDRVHGHIMLHVRQKQTTYIRRWIIDDWFGRNEYLEGYLA